MAAWAAVDIARKSVGLQQLPPLTVKTRGIFLVIPGIPSLSGDLLGRELVLAGAAQGTLKIFRQIGKLGAGGNAVLRIAGSLIVNPTAQIANVLH